MIRGNGEAACTLRRGFSFCLCIPRQSSLSSKRRQNRVPMARSCFRRFVKIEKLRVFDNALLVAKEVAAGRVGFGGRLLTKQSAEIVEMTLIGGSFLALVTRPFPFELGCSHGMAIGIARKVTGWRDTRQVLLLYWRQPSLFALFAFPICGQSENGDGPAWCHADSFYK